ncbi:MAG: hypothetical protein JXM69_15550 [Anaerolineae bacterium]|nr:hypothetical protein [Anaerolineae bacterium]
MISKKRIYLTIDWQEQNILDDTNRRQVWERERIVCLPGDYPEVLPCSNPACQDGGFEIGNRVKMLLASDRDSEQNSLICRNAIHPDRNKRCLHTIIYTIACIRPYQRERSPAVVSETV